MSRKRPLSRARTALPMIASTLDIDQIATPRAQYHPRVSVYNADGARVTFGGKTIEGVRDVPYSYGGPR